MGWMSPIEEINRYLSPEEELEFKKILYEEIQTWTPDVIEVISKLSIA